MGEAATAPGYTTAWARRAAVGLVTLALAGCSSSTPASSSGPVAGSSASASLATVSTPSESSTSSATPVSPSAVASPAGPARLPVLHNGSPRAIEAGDYVTAGDLAFYPGLMLSIPAGWRSREADNGELALTPDALPNDTLLLWRDVVAVETTNQHGTVGHPLPNVGHTEHDLVTWLTTNKDIAVLEKARSVTIGHGINGTQLAVAPSKTVNFADPGCPDNPRCVAFFTDPIHWTNDFYAIGNAVSRMFISTVHTPSGDHGFFVVLDATGADDLKAFAPLAQPIIDSLQLPTTYIEN